MRFDELCNLFRGGNPKQVMMTWALVFVGGFISLRRIVDLVRWSSLSIFGKIYAGSAVFFLAVLVVFI